MSQDRQLSVAVSREAPITPGVPGALGVPMANAMEDKGVQASASTGHGARLAPTGPLSVPTRGPGRSPRTSRDRPVLANFGLRLELLRSVWDLRDLTEQ